MVLTVTINPLLERRYKYQKVSLNDQNRNGVVKLQAGGKGINVSRQLNELNVQNIALTFLGGANGKAFRNAINKEEISFSFISTKLETRDCAVIINPSEPFVSSFFGEDPEISIDEVDAFLLKLEKMIVNSTIVVFSGSSPCKQADSIFPAGIKLANKHGKISVCDTYGDHLQNCIDASPTVIHNNINETESSLKISLKTEKEKLKYLDFLYSKGVKQAFLTDGDNSFYSSNFDFHYKVTVPKIVAVDPTGSGDAFTSGIVYGWHRQLTFTDQLIFATSLGTANAGVFDVCKVPKTAADQFTGKIKPEAVGKKMKVINDKPE
jgi:1-phosphofructokinase family hexose kinase